jgi:hypothetical protein
VVVGALQPSLGFKDFHHPGWGGGRGELGPTSAWAGDPLLPPAFRGKGILQLCGGGVLQPCGGRRTAAAWPGCSYPSSTRATVVPRAGRPRPGFPAPGGRTTRCTPRGRYSCSGTVPFSFLWQERECLPVHFGAAAAHWCSVGGQVVAVVGAEAVVAIGEAVSAEEVASADETVSATCAPGLRLFGFNGWFSSPMRGRERGSFSSSVCPEAITAAVLPPETKVVVAADEAVAGEPPGVCYPAGPLVWRLFIPAGVEPESRL